MHPTCKHKVRPALVASNGQNVSQKTPRRLQDPWQSIETLVELNRRGLNLLDILPVVIGHDPEERRSESLAEAIYQYDGQDEACAKLPAEHAQPFKGLIQETNQPAASTLLNSFLIFWIDQRAIFHQGLHFLRPLDACSHLSLSLPLPLPLSTRVDWQCIRIDS